MASTIATRRRVDGGLGLANAKLKSLADAQRIEETLPATHASGSVFVFAFSYQP